MSFQEARSRDDFRVAIICAMPLEADMVTRILDIEYNKRGKNFGKAKGDRNVYTTGVIGSHNVVLIRMPDIGKIKATAAATEARISFRNIQIAFVVGTCGVLPAHPETKEDIVLGDCIISRTIVQYDYGRRHSGNFTTKPALPGLNNPYIPSLLAMLQTAEDRQILTKELMIFLREMHRKSSLEDLYPGPGRDRLYRSGYRHAHPPGFGKCPQCVPGTDKCLLECETMGCSSDCLIKRDRLASFTGVLGSPKIHFGNVGSGDSVMESSSERDRIAHEYNLIAFEMEGAGVWNSFPTVVIKSASDYADSHKNKGWQYYAAAVSAAGLKAFLQKWTSTEKAMSQAESTRWSMISSDTDDTLSIASHTPTTTFEMDATIMSDRRYQQAFPSLFRRMIGTGWGSSTVSQDHDFNQVSTMDGPSITNQSSERPAKDNDTDMNEIDLLSPTSGSDTCLDVPSIDLLKLSVDVGPNFSLSMAVINIESIKPKFGDLPKHEPVIPQYADIMSTPTKDDYPPSIATPKLNRHPSNGTFRDLYLSDQPEDEIDRLLLDDTALIIEVTQHLIGQAKIPGVKSSSSEQEIFYPANILNPIISEMLDTGLMKESKRLIASLVIAIQEKVFANDNQLVLCAFWLTNVHDILSFFYKEKHLYHQQMVSDSEYGSLVEIAMENIQSLEFNIYFTMVNSLKKKLRPMIIPVVIELQDLPGSSFRMVLTPPDHVDESPIFSMNNLLSLFDDVFKTMQVCDLEENNVHQIFAELLRYIGVVAFNDLLQRKNFLSQKRGRQISYNIIRIEEWCQAHGMVDKITAFKELSQAIDVLRLKKHEFTSWKIIQDTYCMLSSKQIRTLFRNYVPGDNEKVIKNHTTNAITRSTSDGKPLLLPSSELEEVTYEIAHFREITALYMDPPDWLQAPRLKRLAKIISTQALMAESKRDVDMMSNGQAEEEAE